MENITFNVTGMTCGHCVKAIEGNVGALSGVRQVAVSLGEGKVRVEFDPNAIALGAIKDTIEELGYQVA